MKRPAKEYADNDRHKPMNCEDCGRDRGRGIEQPYQTNDEMLSEQLERLWKTDFGDMTVDTKVEASVEDRKALDIVEKSLRIEDDHFQAALHWRTDPPDMPNNKQMVERRLRSLKNRLTKDSKLLEKYTATMEDYITKGYAKKIPLNELTPASRPVWYLPHHPVMHPNKPEKVRVVFDCAAEYQGTSLNQQLLQGPDLANPLVSVLIRFREEPVALVADIESMFHQIGVDPKDRDTLRFLWWENGDLREEPREYRMVRHVFGATSSPSIANLCVKKAASASHDEFDAETLRTVERNMYVDDLMKSTSNTELAINLARQLIELMKSSGFRSTKWISNDQKVISEISESERAQSLFSLEIDDLPTESTLGLAWNIEDDEFVWKARSKILTSVKQKSMTRRAVLSAVCSLFDPLGFVAPSVMKGKLLLQELCRQKVEWDEVLGEREKEQWDRWLEDLSRLKELRIERCFKPKNFGEVKDAQLHLFSDGSRMGYGAVACLRVVDVNDNIHVTFIIGRARVAPINEISIPRLELTAAVISVKLSKMIQGELDFRGDSVTYWTDCTSVLKCIYNEKKRFHTFESNRLTIIRSGSSPSQWRYVSSENNPADDASKGLKLNVMLKNNRWLSGPEFFSLDEAHWPTNIAIPPVTPSDPEVRRDNSVYMTTVKECPLDILIKWYSSWWKLKRGVAWLLRFKELLRKRARKG